LNSADLPQISYSDWRDNCLRYARWTGNTWEIQIVENKGGSCTSLDLDNLGQPHIAYSTYSDGSLRYATWGAPNVTPTPLSSTTLSISPSNFTLNSGGSITLTATLTSDGTALANKSITWSASTGTLSATSGTTNSSGQATVTYTAPTVTTPTTVTAEVSIVENSDATPPVIIDVWTDPGTALQGGNVTVYVEATDDLSGVESVGVWLKDPSGVQQGGTSLRWLTWAGVWHDNFAIPQHAQAGTWTIDVEARDATGNSNYIYCAATLEVTQVASTDNSPPIIHRAWVDPDNISQGGSATVYVDVTDDMSGVESVGVWLKDPSGVQNGTVNIRSVTSEGIMYDSITIPQYASLGTWTIDVGAWDATGNNSYAYDVATFKVEAALPPTEPAGVPQETQPGGSYTPPGGSYVPPGETYTSPEENTQPEAPAPDIAPVDNTPPAIYLAWVNPSTIYQGGCTNVYVEATDDMSGVESVGVWLKDPSGVQSGETCTLSLAEENIWYGTITMLQYASLGTWTIDVEARDATGNSNCAYDAATFKVGCALLITTITSAPQSVQSGKAITVEVSVMNNTTNVTASGVQVYSYIGDTSSSTCTVNLAPGGTTKLALSMTPNGFEPGTYTLGVVAKFQNMESGAKRFVSVV